MIQETRKTQDETLQKYYCKRNRRRGQILEKRVHEDQRKENISRPRRRRERYRVGIYVELEGKTRRMTQPAKEHQLGQMIRIDV